MKHCFFALFLFSYACFSDAAIKRLRPNAAVDAKSVESLKDGEIVLLNQVPMFSYDGRAKFLSFDHRSAVEDLPDVIYNDAGSPSVPSPEALVGGGSAYIEGILYTNNSPVKCGTSHSGIGGYDTYNPFGPFTLGFAYVYLVPDGTGFGCIISSQHAGLLLSVPGGWRRVATITKSSISKKGHTRSWYKPQTGVFAVRTTDCFEVFHDVPPTIRSGLISITGDNNDWDSLDAYSDSSCTKKIASIPSVLSGWYQLVFDGKLAASALPGDSIYLKGTPMSGPSSPPPSVVHFTISNFYEETLGSEE